MRILFITPSYKPAYIYGGPAVSVSELAEALAVTGHTVTVYTTTANGREELPVKTGQPIDVNGVTVFYFKRQTGDHTHVSFGLWNKLRKTASKYEVVHLQSWWSILIIGAAAICRLKACWYIVSPRGMLSAYSFQRQNSKAKKIIHRLAGHYLLKKSYLHATTRLEWDDCMQVNQSWKGFVLPNLVRLPEKISSVTFPEREDERLVFGFLSRIDPKKGIEMLMEALAETKCTYQLKIAGAGEEEYIASLKKLAKDLKIDSKIEWCGWMKGESKFQFLQSVDVFVLTSYNENFANTVIEALGVGTPVFLSKRVGLADFVQKNEVGWVCDTDVASIRTVVQRIFAERSKLQAMRKNAPVLIQKEFNKINLANQYNDAYEQCAERKLAGDIRRD